MALEKTAALSTAATIEQPSFWSRYSQGRLDTIYALVALEVVLIIGFVALRIYKKNRSGMADW